MGYFHLASRLGDEAWDSYSAGRGGPPGGSATAPNGDIVVFDSNGAPDYTIPHQGSGTDADINKDPSSPFYGWTNLQLAQFAAAKGATGLLTDAVRATASYTDPVTGLATQRASYDADVVASNDAALAASAAADPMVAFKLANPNPTVPAPEIVQNAIDAVTRAGGDPTQPTQILDRSGATAAIVQQLPDRSISIAVPRTATDVSAAGVVNTVTGWIDNAAGTITNIGTQIQKIGNAIEGGAAGAQAGYNAPTNLKPYLIAGAGILAAFAFSGRRRRS